MAISRVNTHGELRPSLKTSCNNNIGHVEWLSETCQEIDKTKRASGNSSFGKLSGRHVRIFSGGLSARSAPSPFNTPLFDPLNSGEFSPISQLNSPEFTWIHQKSSNLCWLRTTQSVSRWHWTFFRPSIELLDNMEPQLFSWQNLHHLSTLLQNVHWSWICH